MMARNTGKDAQQSADGYSTAQHYSTDKGKDIPGIDGFSLQQKSGSGSKGKHKCDIHQFINDFYGTVGGKGYVKI